MDASKFSIESGDRCLLRSPIYGTVTLYLRFPSYISIGIGSQLGLCDVKQGLGKRMAKSKPPNVLLLDHQRDPGVAVSELVYIKDHFSKHIGPEINPLFDDFLIPASAKAIKEGGGDISHLRHQFSWKLIKDEQTRCGCLVLHKFVELNPLGETRDEVERAN